MKDHAMVVRTPTFDFSHVKPHWAPNIEFAHGRNAASIIPSHIEPYLLKVMRMARPLVEKSNPRLAEEIGIFIRQESVHMRMHNEFNKIFYEHGYDRVADFEKELSEDCKRLLATRSLKFNLAYADGFESMGAAFAQVVFEGEIDEFIEDADPVAAALWKWHMAEEFEHRNVVYQTYMALYGKNWFNRYFYRVYGFIYAVRHLGDFSKRLSGYLISKDRQSMTADEIKLSKQREKRQKKVLMRSFFRRLLLVLSPFYNPAKKKTPAALYPYLEQFPEAIGNAPR